MYKSVIDIRREIPSEKLRILAAMADIAFHNRAGQLKNKSNSLRK